MSEFLEQILASDAPVVTKNIARLVCQDQSLCHDDGRPYQARCARAFQMHQPTFNRIIKGESQSPNYKHLKPIADYFGLSVDDLFVEEGVEAKTVTQISESGLSADEQALVMLYRLLPREKRKIARSALSDLIE